MPSGNGDIGSALKILPNVQYDITQLRSTTPGEIDPAKVSISGGLHYQNNFQLDGVNMNNNLNPTLTSNDNSWVGMGSGRSQGLAVDTSLLESITVLDSNVSAAYGGFTGGVVEATTKRPKKDFGANVSYQITQGNANPKAFSLTNYHLDESTSLATFLGSADANNQPIFTKHLIRASVESKINDKLSVMSSFNATLSFIPLFQNATSNYTGSYDTPINRPDIAEAKQTQKRQIYNYFIKGYYDPSDSVRLEVSYTYAPQYDYRFMYGTQDDYFNKQSGGHNFAFKAYVENAFGLLTYTGGYQFLETSSRTNYNASKAWQISEAKNWGNYLTWAREGGHPPVESTQHTFSNKIVQDFKPLELANTIHKVLLGIEASYQYVFSRYYKDHYYSQQQTAYKSFMTKEQQAKCLSADPNQEWCDISKAYDPRGLMKAEYDRNPNVNVTKETYQGRDLYIWQYGQFFMQTRHFGTQPTSLSNGLFGLFLEDDVEIPLQKLGIFNARLGFRGDVDTYMSNFTLAPRLSINYEAPWNESTNHNFASQFTFGANRYYAQNLYAYALANMQYSTMTTIWRNSPDISFDSVLAQGTLCSTTITTNCITPYGNTTSFRKLKVPYADELMGGIAQRIHNLEISIKYIYRKGRDEVRRVRDSVVGVNTQNCATSACYTYTNEGKSTTNVVTFSAQNNEPLEFMNAKHFALFAFDWTNVHRNYTDYSDTLSNDELANQWISWNGTLIRYDNKPAENFNRPYTVRLNTIHNFNIGRTRWLLNNFFRYRSAYMAMASIPASYGGVANRVQPDRIDINGDGVPDTYIDTFRPLNIRGAFNWDIRLGFEMLVHKKHTLFVNMDIFNVLNNKNLAIASASQSLTAGLTATPIYELGRQFWFQVGYKF